MAQRRIDMHRLQELVRLHRQGVGPREVARLLKMSTATELKYRKALQLESLLEGPAHELPELAVLRQAIDKHMPRRLPTQNHSSILQWRDHIVEMMDRGAGARAIYDRLRQEHDNFNGSYDAVKRLCRKIRKEKGPRSTDVAIPVVTQPGDVAQVDFGYVGKLLDPVTQTLKRAYAFVMVLGFSRLMFVDIVFDQKATTWLDLHCRAFEFFGGVPHTLVPDNLKPAVIRAAFSLKDEPVLNRSYRELARHYGFKIDPTPPYAPQKKGKVESGVKYVKGNFIAPRDFLDIEDARQQLPGWVDEIANQRCHGTTGEAPRARFERCERPILMALPDRPFEWLEWHQAKVRDNTHVLFEGHFYSVPWRNLNAQALIRASQHSVTIFINDERVATHKRQAGRGYTTVAAHLPAEREELRQRSIDYWRERAAAMGDEVASFVDAIIEESGELSPLRRIQSIIKLLAEYPPQRACAACQRASAFGNFSWRGLKRILRDNLDQRPVQVAQLHPHGRLAHARFARSIHELLPIN